MKVVIVVLGGCVTDVYSDTEGIEVDLIDYDNHPATREAFPVTAGDAPQVQSHSELDDIMAWEGGEMSAEEEREFFQRLINNGMAWRLQGCYGRRAQQLIECGACSLPDRLEPAISSRRFDRIAKQIGDD